MCKIYEIQNEKNVGYKVLATKDGKFYSTFTTQEISVGKVPSSPQLHTSMSTSWNQSGEDHSFISRPFYLKNFDGKTGAFLIKSCATDLKKRIKNALKYEYRDFKIVIVKITFCGDVYDGSYDNIKIIAGSNIESIEICKK